MPRKQQLREGVFTRSQEETLANTHWQGCKRKSWVTVSTTSLINTRSDKPNFPPEIRSLYGDKVREDSNVESGSDLQRGA